MRLLLALTSPIYCWLSIAAQVRGAEEEAFYPVHDLVIGVSPTSSRDQAWKPGDPLALEISGMDQLADGRLAVATRKGEVWFIDGWDGRRPLTFQRFASGLHEPMGLLVTTQGVCVAQRTEITQLLDTDEDGQADEYRCLANDWGAAGNYHEYVYGPKADAAGRIWITLNIGMGKNADNSLPWRGWGMQGAFGDKLTPIAGGMRSPCGLGANAVGDMFFTDQQGNWVPAGSLHHLRPGVFYGNAEALATFQRDDAPFQLSGPVPEGASYPEAVRMLPELVPPAVWFPYHKMGESATDIAVDNTAGKFGPFAGQLFVGEFRSAAVHRVFLEKINGEYQGVCFPFRKGMGSAVVRLCFMRDGSLLVGLTNRGWTSVGRASHGLQRIEWTGHTPFEMLRVHARPDGFDLAFTKPVDPASTGELTSYSGSSYTYTYHRAYGSDEILTRPLKILSTTLSPDARRVRLVVEGCREGFVHELHALGVRSAEGEPLLHPVAYYTLNAIPERYASSPPLR